MNIFSIWWLAIRPKTLSISVAPVILGSSLAWYHHSNFSVVTFFFTLFSALGIQIGTNLYNDAADFERGADTEERLGPKRAAQQGWLNAQQLKFGAFISFVLAFLFGIYLAWLGGPLIVFLGLASILCGYAYTSGPKPIAYSPLGELFVLLFFGFAAVGGTYYLQTQSITTSVIMFASSIGCLASAILLVNNYRDLDSDRKANKLTLVHYIERQRTRTLYCLLIGYPYVLLFFLIADYSWLILLPLLGLPMAFKLLQFFLALNISSQLNLVLAQTAKLQLVYTLLLSLALIIKTLHT